jgi:hypothetical protein
MVKRGAPSDLAPCCRLPTGQHRTAVRYPSQFAPPLPPPCLHTEWLPRSQQLPSLPPSLPTRCPPGCGPARSGSERLQARPARVRAPTPAAAPSHAGRVCVGGGCRGGPAAELDDDVVGPDGAYLPAEAGPRWERGRGGRGAGRGRIGPASLLAWSLLPLPPPPPSLPHALQSPALSPCCSLAVFCSFTLRIPPALQSSARSPCCSLPCGSPLFLLPCCHPFSLRCLEVPGPGRPPCGGGGDALRPEADASIEFNKSS